MTFKNTMLFPIVAAVVALSTVFTPATHAEDPIPTDLSASEIDPFLGNWKVSIEVMGNEITLFLNIVDINGQAGATLDSPRQAEPLAISTMALQESDALQLAGELTFGESFTLDIEILLEKETPDTLGGTIKDKGGIFNAPLTGERASEEELDSVQGRRPDPTEARANYGADRIRIQFAELEKGNSDWERFQNLEEGDVYTFTLSRATKMYTDLDLKFEDGSVVKTENVAEDYPGVYSLWLKKTGEDSWSLIFNEQPDIWGTRYDPEHDAAEVPLKVLKRQGESAQKFQMEIEETEDGGTLIIFWDDIQWETDFTIQR